MFHELVEYEFQVNFPLFYMSAGLFNLNYEFDRTFCSTLSSPTRLTLLCSEIGWFNNLYAYLFSRAISVNLLSLSQSIISLVVAKWELRWLRWETFWSSLWWRLIAAIMLLCFAYGQNSNATAPDFQVCVCIYVCVCVCVCLHWYTHSQSSINMHASKSPT